MLLPAALATSVGRLLDLPSTGLGRYGSTSPPKNPQGVLMKAFHPTTPERLGAMDTTIMEIERKKTAEQPLVPGL